jgi:hypothetical protein
MMTVNEAASAAWMRLPFVLAESVGEDAVRPNFWAVLASGDWAADCQTGRAFAVQAVNYMQATSDVPMLGRIAAAMPEEQTGLEVGFFIEIGQALLR